MKTLPPVLLLVLCALPAGARLGETTNQIHARYGEPTGQDSFIGLPAEAFDHKGYNVLVVFKDGKSFIEALKPLKDSDHIAPDEAEKMIGKIAGCGQWSRRDSVKPPGIEFRGTNGTVAMLSRSFLQPDSLIIYSSEAAQTLRLASAPEPEAATNASRRATSPADPQAEALRKLRQDAINGVSAAQCALGKRYLTGDGLPKNEELARAWLEKAAAKGSAEAVAALRTLEGK